MMTVKHTVSLDAAGQAWEITLTAGPAPDWDDEMSAALHIQLTASDWVHAAMETVADEPAAVARAVAGAWPGDLPLLTRVTVRDADGTSATWAAS